MKNRIYSAVTHYGVIFCGAAILSFGLFNIHSQSAITEGGVLGTVLLIDHWTGISPGITNPLLDLCCYLLGWKFLGNSFLKNALFASISFAICYGMWESVGYMLPDMSGRPMFAAITGAVFVGIGVGIVVKKGGACGSVCDLFSMDFNHHPKVEKGLMEEECTALLTDFFEKLRIELRTRPKWKKST